MQGENTSNTSEFFDLNAPGERVHAQSEEYNWLLEHLATVYRRVNERAGEEGAQRKFEAKLRRARE
jgi:hypothetical protein